MSGIQAAILAGQEGGGTGTELASLAAIGSTLPLTTSATLDPAFYDGGFITEDGLKRTVNEESTDVYAYGVQTPVRTLKTKRKVAFELAFMQTSPVALEIYHQLPLGSIVPDGTGAFALTEGPVRTERFAGVFTIVDGTRRIRAVCPIMEQTGTKEFESKAGTVIIYGVTLSAYPDALGNNIYWYFLNPELAT